MYYKLNINRCCMKLLTCTAALLLVLFITGNVYSQDDSTSNSFESGTNSEGDSIEVFIIDSYITPEQPYKFMLSFFTSSRAKSTVVLQNKYTFVISDKFTENHKAEIDLTGLVFDSARVPYVIYVEDSLGNKNRSENSDVAFSSEYKTEIKGGSSSRLLTCCFGGIIFGLPSPTYVNLDNKSYFSLTKEIPFLSLYKGSFKYPVGFFSVEYAFLFHAELKNYFRFGYKHIFEIPYIEYISPGINGVTNFDGYNGISPELTFGILNFYDVFTLFVKYRYTFQPSNRKMNDFHEIGIGLYSNFFTFRLDI